MIEDFAAARFADDRVMREDEMRDQVSALRELMLGAPEGVPKADFARVAQKMATLFGADFVRRRDHVTYAVDLLRDGRSVDNLFGRASSSSKKPEDVSAADFVLIHELAAVLYSDERVMRVDETRRQLSALRELALGAPADVDDATFERIDREAARLYGADFAERRDHVTFAILALREDALENEHTEGVPEEAAPGEDEGYDDEPDYECPSCGAPLPEHPAATCAYCKKRLPPRAGRRPDPAVHDQVDARVAADPNMLGRWFLLWCLAMILAVCCLGICAPKACMQYELMTLPDPSPASAPSPALPHVVTIPVAER